jgi:FlaA1/EpsC-like NDP-sugar epimerase
LYEELFFDAEHATPTSHPKVLRARNASLPVGVSTVVNDLIQAAHESWPADEIRVLLKRLVPDYEPSLAGMPVKHQELSRKRDSGGRPRLE